MAIFNGTDLGVYIGTTLIAAATDVSLTLNAETIDITTKDSAAFRELFARCAKRQHQRQRFN